MRFLQKIVRNGNSAQVTLPRNAMAWCELIMGQAVILEVLEDKSIRIRAAAKTDFLPDGARPIADPTLPAPTR